MMEPKRLAKTTSSPVTRALLLSAEQDEAPIDTANRVALALGAVLPDALAATTTHAASATVGTSLLAGVGAAKLTLCAVLLSGSVGLGYWATDRNLARNEAEPRPATVTHTEQRVASSSENAPSHRAEASPAVALLQENGLPASVRKTVRPLVEHETVPNAAILAPALVPAADSPVPTATLAVQESVEPARPVVASPPDNTPDRELERELWLLDTASRALKSGRPQEALMLLERHRAEIPRKALAPESLVLRVQTLLALGHRAEAEAVAAGLFKTASNSKHALVIRSLLEESR